MQRGLKGIVMLLAVSLLTVANESAVKSIIGIIGGVFFLVFAALQIHQSLIPRSEFSGWKSTPAKNPLLLGSIFYRFKSLLHHSVAHCWFETYLEFHQFRIFGWRSSHVCRTCFDGLCLAYWNGLSCQERNKPNGW